MDNYGIDSIQHWETREAMRNRPQMYLGSNDTEGIYQAFKEIINNATDEALAGYGNAIEIIVDEEMNKVTIRDYGRGVPFGIKERKKCSCIYLH
jgi:Type IIA topoisomerase (DNA gyrase/topo II, topoisomerase IV), B subunit